MRHVDRFSIQAPTVLTDEKGLGKKETEAAEKFYKNLFEIEKAAKAAAPAPAVPDKKKKEKKSKSYPFKAYKNEAIKKALEQLFHGKCAYCESRFASVHPVDIEHWRPKAEVIVDEHGKERRYGYYWLAAEWENLLPSCIDCNRVRIHFDVVEGKFVLLGKGNWFPISSDVKRAATIGEEKKEKPLLLNPCTDIPENHLNFHEEGFITPKLTAPQQLDEKAVASIRFYALNRSELVHDRKERYLLIKQKMITIRSLAKCLEQKSLNDETKNMIEDLIGHELELLHRFQAPEQPFSMMAKKVIDEFINEFRNY